MAINERADRPRRKHHHADGQDHGCNHDDDFIGHADGGDDGIQRKYDIQQHDLSDDSGERRPRSRRPVAFFSLQTLVNFGRCLRKQEQAATDQDKIAPGERASKDEKKRRRQPNNPDNGKQKQNAHPHCRQESRPPSPALLSQRKLARKNRNENDIVDPEHDLKGRQRDQRDQTGKSEQSIHATILPRS